MSKDVLFSFFITRTNDLTFIFLGEEIPEDRIEYTLSLARCAYVPESEATKEFMEARRHFYDWSSYKQQCRVRHEWGVYVRSILDWDWDTASCLERLFELPEAVVQTAPIATVSLHAGKADTWNVSTEATMPMQINVPYKSASGETKYKTFVSCPSSEDVASTGQADEARDEELAMAPELRCAGGKEAKAGTVLTKVSDTAPMRDTDAERGVEQVDEKLGEVTLIAEEPSYSAAEEAREESEIVGHDNSDAPRTRDTALGLTDNESGDETTDEDALGELLAELDATEELHADQISICSVD